MNVEKKIEEVLTERGLKLYSVVSQDLDTNRFIAFIDTKIKEDPRRIVSSYELKKISNILGAYEIEIDFVIVDELGHDFDRTMKSALTKRYPDKVRNSFSHFSNSGSNVWIEPKMLLSAEDMKKMREIVTNVSSAVGYGEVRVYFTQDERIPTTTAILKILRVCAPCEIDTLQSILNAKKFNVPNNTWMQHTMDRLRKGGLIVRDKRGNYFLSLQSIKALGTEKNRRSPDVMRALALRERWP